MLPGRNPNLRLKGVRSRAVSRTADLPLRGGRSPALPGAIGFRLAAAVVFCGILLGRNLPAAVRTGHGGKRRAHANIALVRSVRNGRIFILAAQPGKPALAMRAGAVGTLSFKSLRFSPKFGSPWRDVTAAKAQKSPRRLATFLEPPASSPTGNRIVGLVASLGRSSVTNRSAIRPDWEIWSVRQRRAIVHIARVPGGLTPLIVPRGPQRLCYTDFGRKIVGFDHGSLYFFNPSTFKLLATTGNQFAYHAISLHADPAGKYLLALCTMPGRLEVWNSRTQKRVVIIPPPSNTSWGPATTVAICAGRVAAAWSDNLAIYRARTGRWIAAVHLRGRCNGLGFSANGKWIAACVVSPAGKSGAAARGRISRTIFVFDVGLKFLARSASAKAGAIGSAGLVWWGKQHIVECSQNKTTLWRVGIGLENPAVRKQ